MSGIELRVKKLFRGKKNLVISALGPVTKGSVLVFCFFASGCPLKPPAEALGLGRGGVPDLVDVVRHAGGSPHLQALRDPAM